MTLKAKLIKNGLILHNCVNITPYWLLGLVEGEGYFSVSPNQLRFGVGLTSGELVVLEGISEFLLSLPGKYKIGRKDTNVVGISVDKKAKDDNSKPMAKLSSSKADYLTNVLIPFFDSLTLFSKKKLDYVDWKLILKLKNNGQHFTEEGKDVISLIAARMNNYRLSTSLKSQIGSLDPNLTTRALNLISSPSNYEIQADGKVLIKSSGTYLKGRGNIGVLAIDEKGVEIFNFNSIESCASFFNVHSRTINRRLDRPTSPSCEAAPKISLLAEHCTPQKSPEPQKSPIFGVFGVLGFSVQEGREVCLTMRGKI